MPFKQFKKRLINSISKSNISSKIQKQATLSLKIFLALKIDLGIIIFGLHVSNPQPL